MSLRAGRCRGDPVVALEPCRIHRAVESSRLPESRLPTSRTPDRPMIHRTGEGPAEAQPPARPTACWRRSRQLPLARNHRCIGRGRPSPPLALPVQIGRCVDPEEHCPVRSVSPEVKRTNAGQLVVIGDAPRGDRIDQLPAHTPIIRCDDAQQQQRQATHEIRYWPGPLLERHPRSPRKGGARSDRRRGPRGNKSRAPLGPRSHAAFGGTVLMRSN